MKKITKKKLESLREKDNKLKDYVIDEVLDLYDDYEDIRDWFEDLSRGGCASGMVSGLIYYEDTHKLNDEFYDEIEELRHEWKDNTGEELKPQNDLKNWFAWFAFEETAYRIGRELNIDL